MIEVISKSVIAEAINQLASDIHFMPHVDSYQIFLRINGQLHFYKNFPLSVGKQVIAHYKFLANMDVGEKRRPQSGACQFFVNENQRVELRLSTITDVNLIESLVIRVIFSTIHQAQQINAYFPKQVDLIRTLIRKKAGLILLSGPVNSGKTTTIYQLLRERVKEEKLQVITMEDPVEIKESSFLQTQVNEKIGISYDLLIKSSLRHHPDILFIGEIRDEETARMTLRGALTGHLMIATIHAKDSLGVIARLNELKISQEQLKQSLIGVVSQRLIPRFCPLCQSKVQLSCPHIPKAFQRAALFEILYGKALKNYLGQLNLLPCFSPINSQLRKAWAYGYICQKDYEHFEIL
ncbi:competence protein ComGA [Facklamia miroungae]|uniref:Competence protein ComGA n=1 Tax=Facklamia miroungae TaxID=120956 RepID=A0A1G7U2D1_9LACT|nr:competence type IV pilus ATPase ComGA [Facklamia miroungae]NKZ29882.1 Flp pilus assembly complex ATPase component TadA [Facklamia miroungae]SDG41752.1 competence protein ComGA [Facklamia miroungae]